MLIKVIREKTKSASQFIFSIYIYRLTIIKALFDFGTPEGVCQVATTPLSNRRQALFMCHGGSEMTIINGCPVSQ